VFVSSTYRDLVEARQRVTMTLLECDAFPTGMEIFPAADDDAWTLIKRVIDQSDYYLLLIAGKYGSIDEKSGLSYTEMEYDYATSVDKPVMAFLYNDLGQLKSEQCESSEAVRAKLETFRRKVKKAKHVKLWKSPEELAGQVALTYNKFIRQYEATGWVRADQVISAESLKELIDAKSRIDELEAELSFTRTSAPTGTENLAQGDDQFDLDFYAVAKYKAPGGGWADVSSWIHVKPTWDALFGAIGPLLLQEAEEAKLRERLQEFLLLENVDELTTAFIKKAKDKSRHTITVDRLYSPEVEVRAEEFGTILVQLTALGLIRRSDRKRSVKDSGVYWALTPFGEARTIQLRAIKKNDAGAPALNAHKTDETTRDKEEVSA
jgi:hypothetical protein